MNSYPGAHTRAWLRRRLWRAWFCLALPGIGVNEAFAAEEKPAEERVTFKEMMFKLPATGWTQTANESQLDCLRKVAPGQTVGLSIWRVMPPANSWTANRRTHGSAYFEYERTKARPANLAWKGFTEKERLISGVNYPAMYFQVKGAGEQAGKIEGNGLFLLLFPDDFETRHQFFVVMWQELYKPGKPFSDARELHEIVKSMRAGAPPK